MRRNRSSFLDNVHRRAGRFRAFLVFAGNVGTSKDPNGWLIHTDGNCEVVSSGEIYSEIIKRRGNLRKADGRNVGKELGFGSALPDFDEICGHGGFECGADPVSDTDTILDGEEVCHSGGEFARNIASRNAAATSAITEMINRDGFTRAIP